MGILSNFGSSALTGLAGILSKDISSLASNLIIGYKFYVFIDSVSLAFNKVDGIEQSFNYQTVQEGGLNDQMHFLPSALDNFSTLRFEDGGMTISLDKMQKCFNSVPKEILVLLCTSTGKVVNVVIIHNAVIAKIGIGQLDANSSLVAVNNIDMNYTGFSRENFNLVI